MLASNGPQDNLPQPMNQGVPADDQTNAITNNVMTTNATNPTVNGKQLISTYTKSTLLSLHETR